MRVERQKINHQTISDASLHKMLLCLTDLTRVGRLFEQRNDCQHPSQELVDTSEPSQGCFQIFQFWRIRLRSRVLLFYVVIFSEIGPSHLSLQVQVLTLVGSAGRSGQHL